MNYLEEHYPIVPLSTPLVASTILDSGWELPEASPFLYRRPVTPPEPELCDHLYAKPPPRKPDPLYPVILDHSYARAWSSFPRAAWTTRTRHPAELSPVPCEYSQRLYESACDNAWLASKDDPHALVYQGKVIFPPDPLKEFVQDLEDDMDGTSSVRFPYDDVSNLLDEMIDEGMRIVLGR